MATDEVSRSISNAVKTFYNSIVAQVFSPCGNYLLAGSIYGEIYVFDIRGFLNPSDETIEQQRPSKIFSIEKSEVHSLSSTDKFLIVGLIGKINGYEWKNVLSGKTLNVAWSLDLPAMKDAIEVAEVNAMIVSGSNCLYAGCGDNLIHVYNLEYGTLINSLTEHKDYILDLAYIDSSNMLASASEDGTVRVWDLRKKKSVSLLEPHKQPRLERPDLGKWIGAVSVEKDWLVCGGGPRVGLWHLGSMQLTSTFDTIDTGVHVCRIHDDRVLIGGNNQLSQLTLQGEPLCSIASSSLAIYSLILQKKPHHMMSLAGCSPYLDICTSFNYRDQVLKCA